MVHTSQSIKAFSKDSSFEAAPAKNQDLEFTQLSSDLMENKGLTQGMSRVKTCLIPEEAFRETLINALAHRD